MYTNNTYISNLIHSKITVNSEQVNFNKILTTFNIIYMYCIYYVYTTHQNVSIPLI